MGHGGLGLTNMVTVDPLRRSNVLTIQPGGAAAAHYIAAAQRVRAALLVCAVTFLRPPRIVHVAAVIVAV